MAQVQWKGRSFNQIYSFIQKNNLNLNTNTNPFLANPLKHYRREIGSAIETGCNVRTSTKLEILNRPNGTVTNTSAIQINGLEHLSVYNVKNNNCEKDDSCVLSPSENARRRVRSSGMIKRKFDNNNNSKYYTSTNQYLISRELTFQQNQYTFFRSGNSMAKPGTNLASANVYAPQGSAKCKKFHITTATSFKYQWFDTATEYTVNIPVGYYDVEDINRRLKQQMFINLHYFIVGTDGTPSYYYNDNLAFLLNIGFNNITNNVELQVFKTDTTIFDTPGNKYSIPFNNIGLVAWTNPLPTASVYPLFIIESNGFQNIIGVNAASYPVSNDATLGQNVLVFESTSPPSVTPLYRALHYKPNNPQFGQQGAVSSGDLLTRKKYNSITNSTVAYRAAFGSSVANALAYGVASNGYTVKDKIGYPIKKTPKFSKYSSDVVCCMPTTISNII